MNFLTWSWISFRMSNIHNDCFKHCLYRSWRYHMSHSVLIHARSIILSDFLYQISILHSLHSNLIILYCIAVCVRLNFAGIINPILICLEPNPILNRDDSVNPNQSNQKRSFSSQSNAVQFDPWSSELKLYNCNAIITIMFIETFQLTTQILKLI